MWKGGDEGEDLVEGERERWRKRGDELSLGRERERRESSGAAESRRDEFFSCGLSSSYLLKMTPFASRQFVFD